MNYPLFLASRLSLSSNGKKNMPAVTVAIIATALSVAVMITSVAIVLGFKNEIRNKVVGFNGHISLFKVPLNEEDDNLLELNENLKTLLEETPFVTDYSIQASLPAILKTNDDFKGVYLKGLNGKESLDYIARNLESGEVPDYSIEDNKDKILISKLAKNQLLLSQGDKIDTYFITDDIRVRRLEIAGIFNTHFEQYDDVLIFGSPALVSQLGSINSDQGTYLLLYIDNFDKIEEYTGLLQERLNNAYMSGEIKDIYKTDNVLSQGRGFFSWLSLLDTNVIVILILMLTVGSVTLISGMLIIILQRKKFIGLMRALGARKSKIREVFIYMALKITVYGLCIGNSLILVFLFLQQKYHFLKLNADSYYIDFVPVHIPPLAIISLNIGVLIITYLVLVLPSRFVGKISPAETIQRD